MNTTNGAAVNTIAVCLVVFAVVMVGVIFIIIGSIIHEYVEKKKARKAEVELIKKLGIGLTTGVMSVNDAREFKGLQPAEWLSDEDTIFRTAEEANRDFS